MRSISEVISSLRILIKLFSIIVISNVRAANWAQSSGRIQQNTAISKYPGPDNPHWSQRHGMVTIVTPFTNEASFPYLYVLGGESYTNDFTAFNYIPGLYDFSWENGFKNDVWRTTGTTWRVDGDYRIRTPYGRKVPRTTSQLTWESVSEGKRPRRGVSYERWIDCNSHYQDEVPRAGRNCTGIENSEDSMWSPRRFHAGLYWKGELWILGGRAREFVVLPHEQSLGGILGPLVADVPLTLGNDEQQFTTQREVIYLKNDVWKSADGFTWDLVTPGCRTNKNTEGTQKYACSVTSDCYGSEQCIAGTCVCQNLWGPREHHAVAEFGGYMYVSGGYGAQLYPQYSKCGIYFCGNIDATGYRIYLSDIWRTDNGRTWTMLSDAIWADPLIPGYTIPLARGGHAMLVVNDTSNVPYLWVVGGQGGSNRAEGGPTVFYNDIWRAPLRGNNPVTWELVPYVNEYGESSYSMPWMNRTGHAVVLEEKTPDNLQTRTLYLYGGENNGTYFDDLWAWRIDNPNDFWREDFTMYEYYGTGDGPTFQYFNNSPTRFYVTPESNLSALKRFWIPTNPSSNSFTPYELRPYLTTTVLAQMYSAGLNTIRDLAEADLYTILKLRGFDYPQVPEDQRLNVPDICDYRALAIAVVQKCSVDVPILYNGEQQMPWNVIPVFGGPPPENQTIKWHGRPNYNFLLPGADDPTVLTEEWDGCTYVPQIEGLFGPDVPGLGYVDQVTSIRNPAPILQNLFCRQTPGARAYHGMVMFEERLYVVGGQKNSTFSYADAWYRDARLPNTRMINPPKSHTPDPYFPLSSNKPGCFFEYRLWDPYNFKEVRGWAQVVRKASVSWLNWRKGGPGTGRYQIYFRAVDPAGNRDYGFQMGSNVYNWYYVSPTPWDIIFSVVGAFIGLCIAAYFEYRRRVKKAAMERYAMKRMRRKFKAMQRDIDGKAVDWRTLYMESKQAEEAGAAKDRKKKIKKTKEKATEKREKEKKKREKEKELIKKKLKAAKDIKDKNKKGGSPEKIQSEEAMIIPVVTTKKSDTKNLKSSKVIPGDDLEAGFMFDKDDQGDGRQAKTKAGKMSADPGFGKKSVKVLPTTEAGPGELLAAKNTEMGFKQRKVNKRMKDYEGGVEEKDNNEGGGGGPEKDLKKDS